jgi:hypothetical protein
MDGVGPDGKPTGQRATYTGASRATTKADTLAQHQIETKHRTGRVKS